MQNYGTFGTTVMYMFVKSVAINVNSFAKDLNVSVVWENKTEPIIDLFLRRWPIAFSALSMTLENI